jgi:hypothetical protein
LFTTDTFDLYIGNGTTNTRFQKYIASGTTSQYLRGDGTLATFPSLTGFVPYTGATANVDLGTHTILAQNATISSSGSGNTATITHSSGSGIGLNITKGGNGEGLYINKTSGTGNAATIIGTLNATTLVKSGGTSTQYLMADGTTSTLTNPVTGSLTTNYLPKATGATTLGNSLVYDNGTNVGIGTNSPIYRFHLNTAGGTPSTVAVAGFQNEQTTFVINVTSVSTGSALVDLLARSGGTVTSSDFSFSTRNAGVIGERMRITSGGNILIGSTTDSGEKLQVNGTMKVTGASTFGDYITQTSASTQIILNRTASGAGVKYQTSGTNNWIVGTGQATVGTDYSIYNYSTGTGAINITYSTNNVQIGSTTDSGEKLQVTGTMKVTGATAVGGTLYSNSNITESSGYQLNATSIGYSQTGAYGWITAGGAAARTALVLNLGGGNVGIGMTPTNRLDVNGTIGSRSLVLSSTQANTSDYNWLVFNNGASGYGDWNIYKSSSNDLSIGYGTSGGSSYTQALTFAYGGNLGLGVTPSAWGSGTFGFDIGSGSAIWNPGSTGITRILSNAYNNGTNYIYKATRASSMYQLGDGSHIWYNAISGTAGNAITFTQAMTLTAAGNLLINTTTDSGEKIRVNGTILISNSTIFSYSGFDATGALCGTSSSHPFRLVTNNTERLQIASTGEATFTSSVTANAGYIAGTGALASDVSMLFKTDTGDFSLINQRASHSFGIYDNLNTRYNLNFSSTGDATFSSSVTATQLTTTRATTSTNNYLQFTTGGTTNWQIGTPSSLTALSFLDGGVETFRLDTGGIVSLGGNFGIGGATFGTSATRTLAITSGTAPTTSPADRFQMYSNDVVAGNAAPHFRTENGAVIKLYQETTAVGNSTISVGGGSAVLDDTEFDGYTLRQIVKALRNQGILQ